MPRTTTREVPPAKGAYVDRSSAIDPNFFRAAKDARSRMNHVAGSQNEAVLRCHRCPQASFCDTCHGINRARLRLGLIQPKHQGDHRNNILYPLPINRKMTPRLVFTGGRAGPTVGGHVSKPKSSWRRGYATIDGVVIYEGPLTRSEADAWTWVQRAIAEIRHCLSLGISFEA